MFLCGAPVFAQELRIRGVMANPSADESTEWIAIENTVNATVSAAFYSVRDTMGKVVEYELSGVFQPLEVRTLPRTVSGITLNNDSEGAEFLKNGVVEQIVPVFSSPGNDAVWAEVSGEWTFLSLSSWLERVASRDWETTAVATPSPSPVSSSGTTVSPATLELSLVSPCTSPEWIEVKALSGGLAAFVRVEDSSGLVVLQEELEFAANAAKRIEWAGAKLSNSGEWIRVILPNQEYLFSYDACDGTYPYRFSGGKWVQGELSALEENGSESGSSSESAALQLEADFATTDDSEVWADLQAPRLLATVSSQLNEQKSFPAAPVPDFATEERVFLTWKKRSLFGSLALVFSGSMAVLLTLPHLRSWYNVHKDPW